MKKLLQLLVLVFITNCVGQNNSTSFDWAFNTGGRGDSADRMQYNSTGDLIILGTITGTGQFGATQLNGGANIRYIGKRAVNGTMTVMKSFRNYTATYPYVIVPYDLAIDNNDSIILTGALGYAPTPFDFGNGVTLTGKGFFMVKYNAAGVAQWAKLYDLNTSFAAYTNPIALQIMPNDDIYFLAKSPNPPNPTWLIKLNSNGTELWHKEFLFDIITKPENNFFADNNGNTHILVSTSNNSITVFGETLFKEPNATVQPSFCTYLLSFDSSGNKKTFKPITGSSTDYAVEKQSGNVIFNHSSFYAGSPAQYKLWPACPLNYKGFIVTDENYNYLKSQSGTFNPNEESIYPTGNFTFFGCTTSNINGNGVSGTIASGRVINAGSQNYTVGANKSVMILKFYDNNINFSGFVAHPELNSLTAPSDLGRSYAFRNNKIAVSGSFSKTNDPTININGITLTACNVNNTNGRDVFITQIDVTPFYLSNKNQSLISDFNIYPNPTSDKINISLKNNLENATLKITSILGQIVLEKQNLSGNNLSIDVDDLASGMYVVTINDGNTFTTSKFIKE